MAEREEKVESTEIVVSSDGEVRRNSNPNPIFSFFQKLQLFIFPPPSKRDDAKSKSVVVSSEQPMSTIGDESVKEEVKPVAVKVPNPCPDMPSLKLQADECDQNTNPIVLWQVLTVLCNSNPCQSSNWLFDFYLSLTCCIFMNLLFVY
ncbi:hypothetical protein CsSME_00028099 [Camellia sinensis var. sinensis]